MPSPRAFFSTSSRRSRAISSLSLTMNTEPTFSPSRSAIQQRSRLGSKSRTNAATISAAGGEGPGRVAPAVLAAVDQAVLGDDPAHVAGARRPQDIRSVRDRRLAEQVLERAHGGDDAGLVRR